MHCVTEVFFVVFIFCCCSCTIYNLKEEGICFIGELRLTVWFTGIGCIGAVGFAVRFIYFERGFGIVLMVLLEQSEGGRLGLHIKSKGHSSSFYSDPPPTTL